MSETNVQAPVVPEAGQAVETAVAAPVAELPMPTKQETLANIGQKAPVLKMLSDGSLVTDHEWHKVIDEGQDTRTGAYQ